MSYKTLVVLTVVALFLGVMMPPCQPQELDQLDVLYEYLSQLSHEDAKVGFLSQSNYHSVKRKLPAITNPVFVAHEDELTELVLNGSIVAALVSGLPEQQYHDRLHIFSSTIVTLHSILMAPDKSDDTPHGVTPDLSTYDLSLAINAAISRVQLAEIDLELAEKNAPKEIILAHTCKEDDQTQFQVPDRSRARGALRKILDERVIKVLANGPYNWGDNDGNYLVDPPIGFYPDILDAIVHEFRNLSGPDGQKYGDDIRIERISSVEEPFPWYLLFDGSTHISEPYFILDASFSGSGKNCTNDTDCFEAHMPGGFERCVQERCEHDKRARVVMFRPSCTVLGTDSKFFTRRSVPIGPTTPSSGTTTKGQNGGGTSAGSVAAIVVLAVLLVAVAAGLSFVIFKEKRGSPVFTRLH